MEEPNKQENETFKVPLKLHYGSKLHSKSLQKWLENQCQSWVATEPPRSIGTNVYKGKNHMCTIQGHKVQTIQQYVRICDMSLKLHVACMTEGKLYGWCSMTKNWETHMQWSEKYDEMWSYENRACNASDQECWDLWLWMTRQTLNAILRKE